MQDPAFIDPNVPRNKKLVSETVRTYQGLPVYSILEFNLFSTCTRKCSFCPVSEGYYKKMGMVDGMELDFFEKVMQNCAEIGYDGKILFSGFSEPLMHKKLEDILSMARSYLPNAFLEVI